jgi:tRNA threonylcarbamoyladenosine biosynthesis protein TsaB
MNKRKRYLAIETSSPRLSLAVGTDTQILKELHSELEWRHAESLLEGMQSLLKQVHWPIQSINGVAVSIGPGSFTGIRIGLAAARALGQALQIPIAGVSSLPAIARALLEPGGYACPMIDALRGDIFTGLYRMDNRGGMQTLWKEQRLSLAQLLSKLEPYANHPLRLGGDAAILHKDAWKGRKHWQLAAKPEGYPKARHILSLAGAQLHSSKASYERVIPLYLRAAAAIERRKR